MSELRQFKFTMTLVTEFKKIESDNATKYMIIPFILTQKQKQLLMKATLKMHLNQSIV